MKMIHARFHAGAVLTFVASVCSICTFATTRLNAQALKDTTFGHVPGVPSSSRDVTVIPFRPFFTAPWITIQAEVDGHRGIFSLDTGSPVIFLNATYLRRNSAGGLDTVVTENHQTKDATITIHTVQIGTLVQLIDSMVTGVPSGSPYPTNARVRDYKNFIADFGLLGNLGLTALEPFETIIDYVHQRVILIRLDKQGRRLIQVPAYTPRGSVPLVPAAILSVSDLPQWWGIQVRRDTTLETLIVDTGAPYSDITEGDQQQAADQLKQIIDSSRRVDTRITIRGGPMHGDALGGQFLHRLGVVGFNLRTHQLVLYQ